MRLCLLLLPDPKRLTEAALTRALGAFPELGGVSGFRAGAAGAVTFKVAKLQLEAVLLPAPLPDGEAEEATDRSLSGLDGRWTLPPHRAHVVLTQKRAKDGELTGLTAFTRAAAAVAGALGAVGVCWPRGRVTHHPGFFVDIAQSELPLPAWVGVSVAPAGERFELLSVGMEQLALPDLLLSTPQVDGAALELFYDLLAYVARRGSPLPEGDLVGRTDKERLPVTSAPSPLDPENEVWCVTLPAPRKPRAPAKRKKK